MWTTRVDATSVVQYLLSQAEFCVHVNVMTDEFVTFGINPSTWGIMKLVSNSQKTPGQHCPTNVNQCHNN
jgi:hypothetical protein